MVGKKQMHKRFSRAVYRGIGEFIRKLFVVNFVEFLNGSLVKPLKLMDL